jgi:hypothetical protein
MEISTSFQLASMVAQQDRQLQNAHILLMIPDLFHAGQLVAGSI